MGIILLAEGLKSNGSLEELNLRDNRLMQRFKRKEELQFFFNKKIIQTISATENNVWIAVFFPS